MLNKNLSDFIGCSICEIIYLVRRCRGALGSPINHFGFAAIYGTYHLKKNIFTYAFAGGIFPVLMSAGAFASDGTIDIKGSISADTCTVSGGGTGGDVTVTLDKASAGTLAASGQASGFKSFSIALSGCTGTGDVKAGFEPGANTDLGSGRLNLVGSDKAANVQLQLRNADNSEIKVGDSNSVKGATITSGSATLNYLVGYYATGAAGVGSANSSVTYSIVYP